MKKLAIFWTIMAMFNESVVAQHYIVFFAYPAGNGSLAGHAYISFITKDYAKQQTVLDGKWGFHPVKQSFKAVFSEETGKIEDERKSFSTYDFVVEITDDKVYEKCKKVKEIWESKKYGLIPGQTCVGFVKDVAKEIPNLIVPSSFMDRFPKNFLVNLRKINSIIDAESRRSLNKINDNEHSATLSEGARLLFCNIKTTISISEQNDIYTKLQFNLSKDKKKFIVEDGVDYPFSTEVFPTDMNKDGNEEIFITYGNIFTSGQTGSEIVLFIKNKNGDYEKNLGFSGLTPEALSASNQGYFDLVIGGPGFEFPVWKWNGNEYVFYRRVTEKDMKTIKSVGIITISKAYENTIK